jgi:acyl-coenzyme A synthetase/AMP-(fatty) acid ligase
LPAVEVHCDRDHRILVTSDASASGADELRFPGEFAGPGHRTSDEGFLSKERLFLSAHVGAAINVAGRKVSAGKVARAIASCPGVMHADVTGRPSRDFERFQEIVATVTVGEEFAERAFKRDLPQKLPSWEIPRQWIFNKRES